MSSSPMVSFCIPTFNRCRYLESLLTSLTDQLSAFPYSFEILIADNASPDRTRDVVGTFSSRLPIRYIRHEENIGGYPNCQFVMSQAIGRYLIYLSDDDTILADQVAGAISKMEADPEIVVVYAPWLMFDLVAQQEQGQFYSVPHDVRIGRNQHGQLLDCILRHQIFPEIQITRRDAFQATMPRINEHAFLAFMHSADYLTKGAVLIQQQPFYVAITRYFDDEQREQLGNDEAEYAWDRYRGGLEYMLARSGASLSTEERNGFYLRVQEMIAVRMSVAVRLRYAKKCSPVDTYYIAMRIRGMGFEQLLPVPLKALAFDAMTDFLLKDIDLNRGVLRLIYVGKATQDVQNFLLAKASIPVEFVPDMTACDHLSDAILFIQDSAVAAQQLDSSHAERRNVHILHERDLVSKFGP